MNKIIYMIIIIILSILLGTTNPNKNSHIEKIIEQFKSDHPVVGLLLSEKMLTPFVKYENYAFFSRTKIGKRTISAGFLGNINVKSISLDILKELNLRTVN